MAQGVKKNTASLESAKQKTLNLVNVHRKTLSQKRLAMLSIDDYGLVKDHGWTKECSNFVKNVIYPKLSNDEISAIDDQRQRAIKNSELFVGQETVLEGKNVNKELFTDFFQVHLEENIAAREHEFTYGSDLPVDIEPLEFEHWCAQQLIKFGWDAKATAGSGDQGADVIATKGDRKLVLQCKLYSSPVGNKAVQEVYSAKQFYHCTEAAVVTNNAFTPSAQKLANSASVKLLLHTELSNL